MALFNFFKKKPKQTGKQKADILLSMPMFNDNDTYNLAEIIRNLRDFWKLDVTKIEGDNNTASFNIDGETVALANVSAPIPNGDIEGTAVYAYNWPSALKDLEKHTGHAIVAVITSNTSTVNRFRILSKVISSILITSKSIAVYQGAQSLLIPRKQYLSYLEELESGIPIMLWIYIGLKKLNTGNCGYTYGLKDFEKKEIEIIDSELSLEEIFDYLFNIAYYVLSNDVTLKEEETLGLTAEQKITFNLSKGVFVEEQSIKLNI